MDSHTRNVALHTGAAAFAGSGVGLILFGGAGLTALGVVVVVLGLVALIPAASLAIADLHAT